MSHTTMIRWNASCRKLTVKLIWQRRPETAGNTKHKGSKMLSFSITITWGATCNDSENAHLFVLERFWWSIFVVLKSPVNRVPAVPVVAWSEATQRNLSWKQLSWSAEVTAPGLRIKGHLSSHFVWAGLGFALLANAYKCTSSHQSAKLY